MSDAEKTKVKYVIGHEIFEVDSRYRVTKQIGSGSYGKVAQAKDSVSGSKVAIKKIKDVFVNTTDAKRILREIIFLRHLNHENIVHLNDLFEPSFGSAEEFKDLYLIMDYMQSDLKRVIYSDNELSNDHIAYIMYQVFCALVHMHSGNIVHRDLKPGNILVNSNCKAKLCDLGLARGIDEAAEEELTEYVVTRWYRAPELTWGENRYSTAIDIWSAGCILAELLNRETLFRGENYVDQLSLIISTLGTPSEEDLECVGNKQACDFIRNLGKYNAVPLTVLFPSATAEAIDLLGKILMFNPANRITAEEAVKHPFFAKYYNEAFVESSKNVEKIDFEYEKMTRTKENIRDLIFVEIAHYRPEAFKKRAEESMASLKSASSALSGVASVTDNGRRKSN